MNSLGGMVHFRERADFEYNNNSKNKKKHKPIEMECCREDTSTVVEMNNLTCFVWIIYVLQ